MRTLVSNHLPWLSSLLSCRPTDTQHPSIKYVAMDFFSDHIFFFLLLQSPGREGTFGHMRKAQGLCWQRDRPSPPCHHTHDEGQGHGEKKACWSRVCGWVLPLSLGMGPEIMAITTPKDSGASLGGGVVVMVSQGGRRSRGM